MAANLRGVPRQAVGVSVCVHDLKSGQIERWLDGHSATVTATAFVPHRPGTLISVSEDRTFVIWDVDEGCSTFTSCIESPSPFVTVAIDSSLDRCAIGSADGVIRFYTFRDFKLLQTLDYPTTVARKRASVKPPAADTSSVVVTARGGTKPRLPQAVSAALPTAISDERGHEDGVLLQLEFVQHRGRDAADAASSDGVASVLTDGPRLLYVGMTFSIGVVDSCSMQVVADVSLQERSGKTTESAEPTGQVQVAGGYTFDSVDSRQRVLVCGAFDNLIELVSLRTDFNPKSPEISSPRPITMLSDEPLLEDSPLHAVLNLAKKSVSTKSGDKNRSSKSSMSSPVTFGRKIKSSGYAAQTKPAKMFQPKTDFGTGGRSKERRTSGNVGIDSSRLTKKSSGTAEAPSVRYPVDCDVPTRCSGTFAVSESARPVALHSLKFSPSGRSVAVLSADSSVSVVKVCEEFASSGCSTFVGHSGSPVSADWSADNKYLMTASRDHVLVWEMATKSRDPLLNITKRQHNFKPKDGESPEVNAPFSKGRVCSAQFYYMDKFVLVGHADSVSMYKYLLDPTVDDLKRRQTKSRYREVITFSHPGAKTITAVTAANNFFSNIVLTAGSDRSINVFDMNRAQNVLQIPNAQARAPHLIQLNHGSRFAEIPAESFNLFFTAAATDGIAMWDLRSGSIVRRFAGHHDRATPVGLDFSPCGRYVATGSEDRHAYVYDVRTGTAISKLSGHGDVVNDVSFRPQKPGLVTSCVDGKLRSYN